VFLYNDSRLRERAIVEGFHATHQELAQQHFGSEFSGTTVVSVVVCGNKLISANSGDSRAILGSIKHKNYVLKSEELETPCESKNGQDHKWVVKALTVDHKPDAPEEKRRIEEMNGKVDTYKDKHGGNVGPYRVWVQGQAYPGLAMSRSLGD
jgi:serine/threonine protein phosphatase PrpC